MKDLVAIAFYFFLAITIGPFIIGGFLAILPFLIWIGIPVGIAYWYFTKDLDDGD